MPAINTSRAGQALHSVGDMQTPGTGYDMNYTPLLPSGLLVGSPFAPGSPSAFQSPQYQNFGGFSPVGNPHHHFANHGLGSPLHTQHGASPLYQNMTSPTGYSPQSYGPPSAHGSYGHMGTGGYGAPMSPGAYGANTSRTVYLGNIPADTSPEEILGHVRSGAIESVRLLSDKNCAFISFLEGSSAVHFHSDAILKKLSIKGQDIKIGWGKPSAVPQSVLTAVHQAGASRNVYLGNLPSETTEEELREELGKFGPIDTVKLVSEKNIGFVHFLSISNAVKAVTQLPQDPNWQAPKRVFYGKDRCAYVSKTQQQNAAQYLGIAPGSAHLINSADREYISSTLTQQSVQAAAVATAAGGANNLGNRTVYLGNIHPETTTEEICNVVRGGLLHHIRYIPDKHICFVTFIDPTAAAGFFSLSNVQGLMIHNRRLKIGWGKHSGPLPPAIALAVSGGASRNVYIGNIDESWSEERLRQDFAEYGEIELVNALREKSCAFVNFTNIANAIKAMEAIKGQDEYRRFKINFGKDRCGNPPRQNNQNSHGHNMQMNQDGVSSPISNGMMANHANHANQAESSGSNSAIHGSHGGMPLHAANGSIHRHHGISNSFSHGSGNGHALNVYLNHFSTQSSSPQDFPQLTPSSSENQSNHFLGSGNGQGSNYGRSNLDPSQAQPHYGHGSSNSFSVAANTGGGAPNAGGLLNPANLSAKSQHSRAISMPAFSQGPQQNSNQGQRAGFGGLGAGLGGLGNAANNGSFGLAIQGDGALPRWAEEEVNS